MLSNYAVIERTLLDVRRFVPARPILRESSAGQVRLTVSDTVM